MQVSRLVLQRLQVYGTLPCTRGPAPTRASPWALIGRPGIISGRGLYHQQQHLQGVGTTAKVEEKKTKKPVSWVDKFLFKLNPFQDKLVTGKLTDLDQDYVVEEKLGFGRYGEVFRAHRRDDPTIVHAIKTIPKSRVTNIYELRNEISLLEKLQHKNIIKVIKVYEEVHTLHIVTELCCGGELFDRIIAKGKMSESDASRFIHQILDALAYCHSMNIVHRDIKPENVLFRTQEKRSPLCLVDFGMGRIYKDNELMSANVGSPSYIAPEVLNLSYSEKCDLWSTGVIMFLLLCGESPFPGATDEEITKNVVKGNYRFKDSLWHNISDEAIDLVTLLLQVDPNKRISAHDALQHPWVVNNGGNRTEPLTDAFRNIQSFNSHRQFKRTALGFIAEHLMECEREESKNEIKRLQQSFEELDTDNDGLLSIDDVVSAMKRNTTHTKSEEQLKAYVLELDSNNSGSIDICEFVQAAMKQAFYLKESSVSAAFEKFDTQGNGVISKEDLIKVFGEENISDIMKEVDLNQDGVIDYREFAIAVRNKEREDVLRPKGVKQVANTLRRQGKL